MEIHPVVTFIVGGLVVLGGLFFALHIRSVRKNKKEVELTIEREAFLKRFKFNQIREKEIDRLKQNIVESTQTPQKPAVAEQKQVNPNYVSPYQDVSSSSILTDAASVAMIANTVRHWNDASQWRKNSDDTPVYEAPVVVSREVEYEAPKSTYSSPSYSDDSSSSSSYSSSSSDSSYSSDSSSSSPSYD